MVSGRSRRLTSTARESEGSGRWLNRSVTSTPAGGRIARDGAGLSAASFEALSYGALNDSRHLIRDLPRGQCTRPSSRDDDWNAPD